jgi:hypothetical protein
MLELDGDYHPASPPISLYQAPRKQRRKTLTPTKYRQSHDRKHHSFKFFTTRHALRPSTITTQQHDRVVEPMSGRTPARNPLFPPVRQSLKCHDTAPAFPLAFPDGDQPRAKDAPSTCAA